MDCARDQNIHVYVKSNLAAAAILDFGKKSQVGH